MTKALEAAFDNELDSLLKLFDQGEHRRCLLIGGHMAHMAMGQKETPRDHRFWSIFPLTNRFF